MGMRSFVDVPGSVDWVQSMTDEFQELFSIEELQGSSLNLDDYKYLL